MRHGRQRERRRLGVESEWRVRVEPWGRDVRHGRQREGDLVWSLSGGSEGECAGASRDHTVGLSVLCFSL